MHGSPFNCLCTRNHIHTRTGREARKHTHTRAHTHTGYYVLFDCPGQVELYTHDESVRNIVRQLEKLNFRVWFFGGKGFFGV